MPPEINQPPPRVFPYSGLLVMMLVCVGVAWLLIPRQDELVDRMFRDQQFARLRDLLASELQSGLLGADPATFRHLSPEDLNYLTHLLRLTPREQLRAVFTDNRAPAYNTYIHSLMLNAVRYVDVLPPAEAWAIIQPHLHRLSATQQQDLSRLLAGNALATENPDLAASILSTAAEQPSSTATTVRAMADAHRWSQQSLTGAEKVLLWLHRVGHTSPTVTPSTEILELAHLCAQMALEGGSPSLALDARLWAFGQLPADAPLPEADLEDACTLALQSTRTQDMLPWLERFLAAMPESTLTPEALITAHREHPDTLQNYRRHLLRLAQIADWNSRFETAFDLHYRLAALGESASIDRCIALTDFLGRAQDTAPLLNHPELLRQRPDLLPALARLEAALGHDEAAEPLLQRWLQDHPADHDSLFDYANLLQDMGREDDSADAFAALVKHFPHDAPAIKKLAEARIRQARYADALDLYAHLPVTAHDHATLENYALLAESLDDHPRLHHALQLQIQHTPQPSVEQYLDLADAATYLEDTNIITTAFADGLQCHPHSRQLRIGLASALIDQQRHEEALLALQEDPNLRSDFEALTLALSLAPDVGRPSEILAFIGEDAASRFHLPIGSQIDLAVLLYLCGDSTQAESILASIPENRDTYRLLAEGRHSIAADDEAARLMTAYLQNNPRATAKEWMFLGELFEELGRDEDARRAYNYSLALLTAELPDTAYSSPASPPPATP